MKQRLFVRKYLITASFQQVVTAEDTKIVDAVVVVTKLWPTLGSSTKNDTYTLAFIFLYKEYDGIWRSSMDDLCGDISSFMDFESISCISWLALSLSK